jgi:hypothetical protein
VAQWSEANAPVTHRWLDEFAGFADRWEEFRAAWKWAQTLPYRPERRPGLHGFVDLINAKAKLDHVRAAGGYTDRKRMGRGMPASKSSRAIASPFFLLCQPDRSKLVSRVPHTSSFAII